MVYGALIAGFAAIVAATVSLVSRCRATWREIGRVRGLVAVGLDGIADRLEATSTGVERTSAATSELDASLRRLRLTLARFAVLLAALDEAKEPFDRLSALLPRR